MTPLAGVPDVVVVGAGAAGCVVAARLAASSSRSVLLLEAGPDLRGRTPAALRDGWRLCRDFDWGYTAAPNPRGAVENVTRSKLVGGTSWMTRFALRGSPADYDEWAQAGNAGWGFDDVLPWFMRLERDVDFGAEPWHGDAGPMPITRYPEREYTDIAAVALRAAEDVGFTPVDDHNRPGATGAGRMPMTARDGDRVTTADAYLADVPANLWIRSGAEVAELVVDAGRAAGVLLADGTLVEGGHVVLCAGVYGDPPILMRSGIGPADHLRSLDIPIRADLPGVGANLADHPAVEIDCGYRGAARRDPVLHAAVTFCSSATPHDGAPDLMLWMSDPEDADSFEISVVLLRPRSRGRVRLRSANPADPPVIELPALTEQTDVERLAEGYGRALELANHRAVRACCSGPAPVAADGDLRDGAWSLPHAVGTCAMGTRPHDGAVVDSSGRVHGVEGVSIVDASIMPDVPSGFTHLSTIMIAERLAEAVP